MSRTPDLPAQTRLVADAANLDFLDSQTVTLPRPVTATEAWNMITGDAGPVLRLAFRLRDAISARFGVKRIGGFTGRPVTAPRTGDRLDFFLVEDVAPDRLVLTERDRHLDVMTCVSTDGPRLTVTTSVVTHNRFGRAYMLPVAPAHRLIVRRMLAGILRKMAKSAP